MLQWKCPTDEELDRPYGGVGPTRFRLCKPLHEAWHETRADLEQNVWGLAAANDDNNNTRFHGHCNDAAPTKDTRYIPIDWSRIPNLVDRRP